jgi:hypothetical protein
MAADAPESGYDKLSPGLSPPDKPDDHTFMLYL